jgi:hypothetical protein
MLNVHRAGDRVQVGDRFSASFQRTLRIPDDGGSYPLPPGLGLLPLQCAAEYRQRVPPHWTDTDFFVPMYQREALWLGFDAAAWKPNAVKVGIGGVDAISGEQWGARLQAQPQNYIVCPDQPWLDGINAGAGWVRQFTAMPLGLGYTIEEQLTGNATTGGIQLLVFEPKPGRFPDVAPLHDRQDSSAPVAARPASRMGIAAGGKIQQAIYVDPYGVDTWDAASATEVRVHIVTSDQYLLITGHPAPPTPVSARTYTEHGLPWFTLYDETRQGVSPSERLSGVTSAARIDGSYEEPVRVTEDQIRKLKGKPPFAR